MIDNWRQATRIVEAIPACKWTFENGTWHAVSDQTEGTFELRCHEVARVVAFILTGTHDDVVDGTYGIFDHSWLEWRHSGNRFILDCYTVGQLPMVQAIDAVSLLPENKLYEHRGPRQDIRHKQIDIILQMLRGFTWWKIPVMI
jgi:hypothetical protein